MINTADCARCQALVPLLVDRWEELPATPAERQTLREHLTYCGHCIAFRGAYEARIKLTKAALRREVLACRDQLTTDQIKTLSPRVIAHLKQWPALQKASTVMAYANFGSEVATGSLLQWLLAQGKQLVLPRVCRADRTLQLYSVADPVTQLQPGIWGIPEPDPVCCPPLPLAAVDCVVVPGVAFDHQGRRLGYGGGFYDRLLDGAQGAHLRPHLIAVGFECQLVPEVPAKGKDVSLAALATEQRLLRLPGK
jgi:5-formyltetrahydrofolate cyclo-ligase